MKTFRLKLSGFAFQGLERINDPLWLAASCSRSDQKNQMSLLKGLTGNYTKSYTNSMTTIELIPERFENKRLESVEHNGTPTGPVELVASVPV